MGTGSFWKGLYPARYILSKTGIFVLRKKRIKKNRYEKSSKKCLLKDKSFLSVISNDKSRK